ncbi:MAG: hypothetical protein WBQ14_10655 [Gaiellaceae bacterium]
MRKRRESVPGRQDEDRSAPAAETERSETEEQQEGRLEDDGFVFWPTSLGDPAGPRLVQIGPRPAREPGKARPPRRRRALTAIFTILFFAGAALTAAAGNEVATLVSSPAEVTAVDTQATDTTATDTTATDTATTDTMAATETATTTDESSATTTTSSSEPDPTTPASSGDETTTATTTPASADDETTPAATSPSSDQPAGGGTEAQPVTTTVNAAPAEPAASPASDPAPGTISSGPQSDPSGSTSTQPEAKPVQLLEPQPPLKSTGQKRAKRPKADYASLHKAPEPTEIEPEGDPSGTTGNVQWINQPLPDPTPASLRLSREFAQQLREASSAQGLDWAFLLAVLRTERLNSSGEVSLSALQEKAAALGPLHVHAGDRETLLAYKHDSLFSRRVLVLEHYYKALGLKALVNGLADSKDALAAKILADQRIEIYPGGREDISAGRVDVRIVAMIAFLSESFGDVRVSCLISGHRLYARPGVISAHIYGRGLDIGALDDVSIYGHQQSSSVTARAVKQILLLPAEMLPRQVISLLGFGGPSFPLADHYDHIHIGY